MFKPTVRRHDLISPVSFSFSLSLSLLFYLSTHCFLVTAFEAFRIGDYLPTDDVFWFAISVILIPRCSIFLCLGFNSVIIEIYDR